MEFKTRFKVYDAVYLIDAGEIVEGIIEAIYIISRKSEINGKCETNTSIEYTINISGKICTLCEKDLYATKKEAVLKLMEKLGYEVSENDLKEIK